MDSITEKTAKDLISALNNFTMSSKDLVKKTTSLSPQSTTSVETGTSRFLRKEDPAKNYYKDSIKTLKEILKTNKDMLAKGMGGFSKGFGSLLALGGLAGFLLTGKTEMLNSVVKGLEKAFVLPVAKMFDKVFSRGLSILFKQGGKFFNLLKGTPKFAEKLIPKATEMTAETLARIGGKFNKAGKLVSAVTGKFTTVEKLMKEAGELGLEQGAKVAEKIGLKSFAKVGGKAGLKALTKIPVLGTILGPALGIYFAYGRWKKQDYIGAFGELASGLLAMIPGLGTPLSLAADALLLFRDFKMSDDQKKQQNKTLIENKGKESKFDIENVPVLGTLIHIKKMLSFGKEKKFGKALDEAQLAFGSLTGFGSLIGVAKSVIDSFGGKSQDTPTTPNLTGVNPITAKNFDAMNAEYKAKTGKDLQVNSAFRSYEEQKELYRLDPKHAANPDTTTSKHQTGLAYDLQSNEADQLEKMGLLDKYGFKRPYAGKWYKGGLKERWHIESTPESIQNADAISPTEYANNMSKMNSTPTDISMKSLLTEMNSNLNTINNSIKGQKIVSKNTAMVSSAG